MTRRRTWVDSEGFKGEEKEEGRGVRGGGSGSAFVVRILSRKKRVVYRKWRRDARTLVEFSMLFFELRTMCLVSASFSRSPAALSDEPTHIHLPEKGEQSCFEISEEHAFMSVAGQGALRLMESKNR